MQLKTEKQSLLIESKNSKELSEAIIKLIKNRELLKQMSINSKVELKNILISNQS